MFSVDQYQLLDFGRTPSGQGRKLECFAGKLVSRISPPAENSVPRHPELWQNCFAEYQLSGSSQEKGRWKLAREPGDWTVQHKGLSFQLKPTPFGHLGIFVEQQSNWDWISKKTEKANRPLKVLNLFAYTGGSTLAAAQAGAEVTHIDSAKNIVAWARENAARSSLQEAPIRWIAEDCKRFVEREIKRGKRYDAIILDPPSFGHGPKGEVWKIERDLIGLLRNCKQLLVDDPEFMVLTCHSPGYGPAELQATFCDSIFGSCSTQVFAEPLALKSKDGRKLNAGNLVRWPRS